MAQETAAPPQFPVLDVMTVTSVADAPPPGQHLLPPEQRLDPAATDTAALIDRIPGVNSYGAGGISSLPSVRGLAMTVSGHRSTAWTSWLPVRTT